MRLCLAARRSTCVAAITISSAACAPPSRPASNADTPPPAEPAACASGPDYAPPSDRRTVPLAFELQIKLPGWLVLDRVCVLLDGARLFAKGQAPEKQGAYANFHSLTPIREDGAHVAVAYVWFHLPEFGADAKGFPFDVKSEHTFRAKTGSGVTLAASAAEVAAAAALSERVGLSWRETQMP